MQLSEVTMYFSRSAAVVVLAMVALVAFDGVMTAAAKPKAVPFACGTGRACTGGRRYCCTGASGQRCVAKEVECDEVLRCRDDGDCPPPSADSRFEGCLATDDTGVKMCKYGSGPACDTTDIASGACAQLCHVGNATACGYMCDAFYDAEWCGPLCRAGDEHSCASLCVPSQAPCNEMCRSGVDAACAHAEYEVQEAAKATRAARERAKAEASLPGLFGKCEANRAVIFRWKKAWIAANRQGDENAARAAEQKLAAVQPQWSSTLDAIRNAVHVATDDEGPRFQALVLQVQRRCSLPSWAGY